MFKNAFVKIKRTIENPPAGLTIGYALGIATGALFILAIPREKNDPWYTITKSDFERAAEEGDALRIRNDLGHFKFYCEFPD